LDAARCVATSDQRPAIESEVVTVKQLILRRRTGAV
jgi:hypothetical protein